MGASMIHMRTASRSGPPCRADATTFARIADMAGEGLPMHLWRDIAGPGDSALSVGTARAARDEGAFSWRNAHVAHWHGAPVGAVIDYDVDDPETTDRGAPRARATRRARGPRRGHPLRERPRRTAGGPPTGRRDRASPPVIGRTGRDATLVGLQRQSRRPRLLRVRGLRRRRPARHGARRSGEPRGGLVADAAQRRLRRRSDDRPRGAS